MIKGLKVVHQVGCKTYYKYAGGPVAKFENFTTSSQYGAPHLLERTVVVRNGNETEFCVAILGVDFNASFFQEHQRLENGKFLKERK